MENLKKKKIKIENKIISDCCESIIGAIYLDSGFEIAKKFILNNWKNYLEKSNVIVVDSKTMLQEYSLKRYKTLPVYKVFSSTGPKHKPEFRVGVKIKNTKFIYHFFSVSQKSLYLKFILINLKKQLLETLINLEKCIKTSCKTVFRIFHILTTIL